MYNRKKDNVKLKNLFSNLSQFIVIYKNFSFQIKNFIFQFDAYKKYNNSNYYQIIK